MRAIAVVAAMLILSGTVRAQTVEEMEGELAVLEAQLKKVTEASLEARFDRPTGPRLGVYDVADLTAQLTDFIRPNIVLTPAGSEFDEEQPQFGALREGPTFFDGDELVDLIASNVRPAVWEGNDASITYQSQSLVVSAPREVHGEIQDTLERLRADLGRLVTIEIRMIRAPYASLPEGALGPRACDAYLARLAKGEGGKVLASSEVTGYSGQQLMAYSGIQRAFVQDYDVEVAQDARIADPIVGVVQTGLSFDVRAMPLGRTAGILLDLRADFGEGLPDGRLEVAWGPVELPRLRRARAHGSIVVPDGGGIVVGGTASEGRSGARVAFFVRARTAPVVPDGPKVEADRAGDLNRRIATTRRLLAAYEGAAKEGGPLFRMKLYPVDDLLHQPMDRPGPVLNILPSGAGGFFDEDDFEEMPAAFEVEQITDLVRSHVAPGSWDELLSTGIEFSGRNLVVVHTAGVHARIAEFLRGLRERTSRLVAIDVEVVGLGDAERRELRDAGSPVTLSKEAVAKLHGWIEEGRATRLHAGRILARSNQRVALADLEPRAYVMDYDVEIAEKAEIGDPIIQMLNTGLVVDVRPIVAGRGSHVVLECRVSRSILRSDPVPQVQTLVGAIETPATSVTRLGCTLSIPIGSTAVVGGGLRTGIEGQDDERALILLTPRLVDFRAR